MSNDLEPLIHFLQSTQMVSHATAIEISGYFTEKELAAQEFHFTEGHIYNEYLFLEEGFMRAFAYDLDGNDITTNFYLKNQIVCEVSSFFTRTVSRENIQALTDCKAWSITYEQLNFLFHNIPAFRDFGRLILVRGFTALKARVLSMITETAEERYATLLKTNPEIFQNAPLKNIASYLGITDTSLSRIRKEFSKK
jgi:CRP-like cAMP-binding protein